MAMKPCDAERHLAPWPLRPAELPVKSQFLIFQCALRTVLPFGNGGPAQAKRSQTATTTDDDDDDDGDYDA